MSGEIIAILAVGVALAGVILTSLRGTEARLGAVLVSIVGIVVAAFRLYLGADRRENPTC